MARIGVLRCDWEGSAYGKISPSPEFASRSRLCLEDPEYFLRAPDFILMVFDVNSRSIDGQRLLT
jgi:hypothetical protein